MSGHDLVRAPVQDLNWLLTNFVEQVPSAAHAVVVSSDGLPVAMRGAASPG
jgi:hypothetical protein